MNITDKGDRIKPFAAGGGATTGAAVLEPPAPASFVPATAAPPTYLLSVAVPVYNERATLAEIIAQIRAAGVPKEILLVDDGSTDGTREYLETHVENQFPDVRVLYHDRNRGKGAAILTAIQHAHGDYLVIQDADLEYDPQDFARLVAPLVSGEADVVYGSRFKGSITNMKPANRLANRILTVAANVLFPGARLSDEATCYKMFRTDLLRSLHLRSQRFDFCPEVTAKVLKRGIRIHEIPIAYQGRTVADGKKIHWTDGVSALQALLKYRFVD